MRHEVMAAVRGLGASLLDIAGVASASVLAAASARAAPRAQVDLVEFDR